MKHIFYTRFLVLSFLFLLLGSRGYSQLTVAADSVECGATSDTLRGSLTGYTPTATGITGDDQWSGVLSIGFTFNYYGTGHTTCLIGSNGAIGFNTGSAGGGFAWSISAVLLGNSSVYNCICGPWCDICLPCGSGGTITYATVGTSPNRKFIATWCHAPMFSCTTQWTTSQIILYETSDIIEVHIAHKTICSGWNSGRAIVGVQNAAGSAATAAPGRNFPTAWSATNEAWQFAPTSGGTSYSVSSISFAPIPFASSAISWYDSTTGAYLGTGSWIHVTPTGGAGTYIAAAPGCDDTTKVYFHLNIDSVGGGNSPVHITSISNTSPNICGQCNATVSLVGINPFIVDTIFYSYNGVPQTILIDSAGSDSTLTIRGLCAGYYDYFYVKQGPCPSNSVGPITISDPAFTASGVTFTDPTVCGACDGTITIHGIIPGFFDTVNYMLGGVPQTPVVAYVTGTGNITLTGLRAGNYTNITVKMSYCVTPPLSTTLTNPPFAIADTSSTNASCSACDGTFTLYGLTPSQSITVNYNRNGVPQAPYTGTSTTAGTLTLTNLCPGAYNNITATLNTCVAGACVAGPVGTIIISPPPLIPIRITAYAHSTECGACNGFITLKGIAPGTVDTIFYNRNGVPQTPVIFSAASDSTVTLYGLCAGDFNNFFVKEGPCPTTTIGTHVVLVDPPIVPGFTNYINYGCNGDTVTFVNTSTSPGFLYYVWSFGDGLSDTTANPRHIYPQGSYHVVMYVTNHHCVDSSIADITLIHPIQAGFHSDSIVCQGTPVAFTNSSSGTPPTYVWSFGDGSFNTGATPTHTYNYIGQYNVRLIATNFIPCSDTAYSTIQVDSQSLISLTVSDSVLCRGTYVTLNGTYTNIGLTDIAWSFGDGDSTHNTNPVLHAFDKVGDFIVSLTTSYRVCLPVTTTKKVTVLPQPALDLGADTSICDGGESPVLLSDNINAGNGAASWLWSTGETTSSIGIASAGRYWATVSVNNCQATDSVWVANDCYMAMPNIFTPNADGINDYFYPRSLLSKGLISFNMDIYNRWGQLIFKTASVEGRGWDGKYNDLVQPEGVYIYIIDGTFKDGKKEHHQGNITLIR